MLRLSLFFSWLKSPISYLFASYVKVDYVGTGHLLWSLFLTFWLTEQVSNFLIVFLFPCTQVTLNIAHLAVNIVSGDFPLMKWKLKK